MSPDVLVWLALLVALGGLFAVVSRRMSKLAARTRNLERIQAASDSINRRFAGVVDPLVRQLEACRRSGGDPEHCREDVTGAQAILAELLGEIGTLAVPAALTQTTVAMTSELRRAARAADLVDHGLTISANTSRGRELEAQTSLKRGVLNLRHAREAFGRLAGQIAQLQPLDLVEPPVGSRPSRPLGYYEVPDPDDADERFNPTM